MEAPPTSAAHLIATIITLGRWHEQLYCVSRPPIAGLTVGASKDQDYFSNHLCLLFFLRLQNALSVGLFRQVLRALVLGCGTDRRAHRRILLLHCRLHPL